MYIIPNIKFMKKSLITAVALVLAINASAQCEVNTFDGIRLPRKINAEEYRNQKGQDFPIDTLKWSGPEAINLLLMGDGYTADELDKFHQTAADSYDALFKKLPFSAYKDWFNLFTISVVSNESGTSMPGVYVNGRYVCPEGNDHEIYTHDTFFKVKFDSYYLHRLCCADNTIVYEATQALMPNADVVGIICNTTEYGGSGGSFLTFSDHASSREIYIHEFGHTFGGLGDEYFAGDYYLYERPNITADPNEETIKWKHWWGRNNVGAFKVGGSDLGNQWYKPVNGTCEMEYLNKQFCPVCREHLIELMHDQVGIVGEYEPIEPSITMDDEDITFAVTRYHKGARMEWEWSLDGTVLEGATKSEYTLQGTQLEPDHTYTLKVKVSDNPSYVRDPNHTLMHHNTVTWTIRNLATGITVQRNDGANVKVVPGGLRITSDNPRAISIHTISGHRVHHSMIQGSEFIALQPGVYIVEGTRVMVR